jgi:hypothetical protein
LGKFCPNQDADADGSVAGKIILTSASMKIIKGYYKSVKVQEKNKFAILGVEVPGRQGAKTQEYLDIPSFRNTDRRNASAYKM